jgi:hypothetical protein
VHLGVVVKQWSSKKLHLADNPMSELHWEYNDPASRQFASFPLLFEEISSQIIFLNLSGQNPGSGSGGIPTEVGLMNNLKVLDLSYTSVALFPETFCNLTRLEFLDLTGNNLGNLASINSTYGKIYCFSNFTSLRFLNVSFSQRRCL